MPNQTATANCQLRTAYLLSRSIKEMVGSYASLDLLLVTFYLATELLQFFSQLFDQYLLFLDGFD